MGQALYIKMPDGTQKKVEVIRSWMASGQNDVYLHASGRYAYKDGTPLKTAADFDILPRAQRAAALSWWERRGRAESEDHYEKQLRKEREEAGDFRTEVPFPDELDAVTYIRKKTGGGRTLAPSAPHAWREWFPQRPDWWGQAKEISFADYTYRMTEAEAAGPAAEEKPAEAEPAAAVRAAAPAAEKAGKATAEKRAEKKAE